MRSVLSGRITHISGPTAESNEDDAGHVHGMHHGCPPRCWVPLPSSGAASRADKWVANARHAKSANGGSNAVCFSVVGKKPTIMPMTCLWFREDRKSYWFAGSQTGAMSTDCGPGKCRQVGLAKAPKHKGSLSDSTGLEHGARSQNVIRRITSPACARLRTEAAARGSPFVVRTMAFSRTTQGWDL